MSHLRRIYELRRFDDPSDLDYQAVLELYIRLISGPIRTQSNEVSYWLQEYRAFSPDQFCVFGFYSGRDIIGYAQMAFFSRERIIAFDYLLLHESHRTHGEYHQFIMMLAEWVNQQHWEVDYVLAEIAVEVSPTNGQRQPPLVALFKQAGFFVANCRYFQPPLGLENEQSDIPAYLLVRPNDGCSSIPVTVFLKLVKTIYFRHYKRWYQPFLREEDGYDKLLEARYDEIKIEAERNSEIELDGVKTPSQQVSPPRPTRSRRSQQFFSSVCVAGLVLAVCFSLLLFLRMFSGNVEALMICLAASLIVSFSASALFYKNGPKVLQELLRFIKAFRRGR